MDVAHGVTAAFRYWYDVVVFKSLVAVTLYALALFLNPNSDMVVSLAATAAPAVALACRGICGFAGIAAGGGRFA